MGKLKGYTHPPTRRGYQVHEVVSALQKAIRRSQVKEAVYWALEMHSSSHKSWCWNRLQTICSEDIGLADRYLPAQIATLRAWSEKAKEGGGMELAHAVQLLATAPKSRVACWMVLETVSDHHERLEIPDEALDQHTRRGLRMGRGTEHFLEEAQTLVDPDDAAQADGWDGMDEKMAHLEVEAREHWRIVHAGTPEEKAQLPDNPRRKRDESWVPPADRDAQESLLGDTD